MTIEKLTKDSCKLRDLTKVNYLPSTRSEGIVRKSECRKCKDKTCFRRIFQNAAIGVTLIDMNGFPYEINETLQKFLGYTSNEFLETKFDQFIHPDDRMKECNLLKELLEGKRSSFQIEKRYIRKDNQIVWGNVTVSIIQDEQYRPISIIRMIEDITQHKRTKVQLELAETARIENEQQCNGILKNSKDGILLTNEKGCIIEWNPAMEELTGLSPEKAFGKPLWEVQDILIPNQMKSPESKFLRKSRIKKILKTGESSWLLTPIESNIKHQFNGYRNIQSNTFLIPTKRGFKLGSIWRDNTQNKLLENKMKQELLKFKIDDGSLYLIKEQTPLLSKEVFKDLKRIGYDGLIFSRTPEHEIRQLIKDEYEFKWLAKTTLEKKSSLFQEIENNLQTLLPRSVVLIDRLDYLISLNGFEETIKFIFSLREIAILSGIVILLSLDENTISSLELKKLEKETREVNPCFLSEIPAELFDILRYVYNNNTMGVKPSYKQITEHLKVTRPTARRRIRELIATNYLQENQIGRLKLLEISTKTMAIFLKENSSA